MGLNRRIRILITLAGLLFLCLQLITLNPPDVSWHRLSSNQCYCFQLTNMSHYHNNILGSTCNDDYARSTTGQNVISVSFYEPPEVIALHREWSHTPSPFQAGIEANLQKMRELYPGFVMRVYTDVPLQGELCALRCRNRDLHWCDIRQTPSHGDLSSMFFMTWRFLPLGDPTVDVVLSRDLDSILTEREQAAVQDWLTRTNKSIHVMRDNLMHNAAILGGTWGASNSRLEESIGADQVVGLQSAIIDNSKIRKTESRGKSEENGNVNKGFDQLVLRMALTQHKEIILAHDSYHCELWTDFSEIRPFPVQRKDSESDFVGNVDLGEAKYNLPKCPLACRPSYGKHWLYC